MDRGMRKQAKGRGKKTAILSRLKSLQSAASLEGDLLRCARNLHAPTRAIMGYF